MERQENDNNSERSTKIIFQQVDPDEDQVESQTPSPPSFRPFPSTWELGLLGYLETNIL